MTVFGYDTPGEMEATSEPLSILNVLSTITDVNEQALSALVTSRAHQNIRDTETRSILGTQISRPQYRN